MKTDETNQTPPDEAGQQPQDAPTPESPEEAASQPETQPVQAPAPLQDIRPIELFPDSRKILVVNGREEVLRKRVINFFTDLRYKPVLTLDKVNAVKSMNEKYLENQDAIAVVVLLTSDVLVYDAKNGKPADALMYAEPKVIFEFGYWLGRFGRKKVFALYYDQKSYRCPTEFSDPIYIPYDKSTSWQTDLCKAFEKNGVPLPKP